MKAVFRKSHTANSGFIGIFIKAGKTKADPESLA